MVTLEERVELLERRMKEVMRLLEMVPAVAPWEWKMFKEQDTDVIKVLVKAGREGLTTTNIAEGLGLENPKSSGRVTVYKALKRIEKISKSLKGIPVVLRVGRRWAMNFDDFSFAPLEGEKT